MPSDVVSGKMSSDIENVDWSIGTTTHIPNVRFGSSSSQTSQNSGDICRICHCESDPQNPLLTPCYCSGSLKYVHQSCLQQWLTASETNSCELCKFPFIMHTKIKPFNEWRSLDMSGVERRRLFCAILFHCAAALCVIWSLCVLIERATHEARGGLIGWPFWTKLVVVTVGIFGGMVFMYIQCRQYLHLCNRWRARNRILLIQNAPEKVLPLPPPSPVLVVRHQHHFLPRNNSSSTSNVTNAAINNNNRPNHGQIIANIENNPLNYERDWTLDDSSQSSFKPCPQGSGSMTPFPFHSSAHNISDHSRTRSSSSTSNGSTKDLNQMSGMYKPTDVGLFKVNVQPSAHRYPNSSVFLENSDILDDKDYPPIKPHHRHSTVTLPAPLPLPSDLPSIDPAVRRMSDTKLTHAISDCELQNGNGVNHQPIFNMAHVLGISVPMGSARTNQQISAINHDSFAIPQITEINFDNSQSTYNPLDFSIHDFAESETAAVAAAQRRQRLSLHTVTVSDGIDREHRVADNRNFFKSLPNLSASSENLLQK